jgi:6-phosphofructokinase 1
MPGAVVTYDQHGHLRLDEVPLEKILKLEIQRRFEERGENLAIVDRTVGYELRSAAPIPFDIDYTRTLGYGAARALLSESDGSLPLEGGLICLKGSRLKVLPFDELRDPETGRTRVRLVDITGESYIVAREYMIRLEKSDMDNPEMIDCLAQTAKMTVNEFTNRFASVIDLAGAMR